VLGGDKGEVGEVGDWDIQEAEDMLTGVMEVAGERVRWPARGDIRPEVELAALSGSGDLVKPGELGWSLRSWNCLEVRESGVREWRGASRFQRLERKEVIMTANRDISTR